MPLFFVVSGYFSTKILQYTLRDVLIKRVWFFLVPYLLWVSFELWTKNLEWQWVFGNEPLTWRELGLNLLLGHNMGWFLHALILFNLALVAVRKLHPALAMLISFAPVLLLPLNEHFYFVAKAVMYLPLFFMGVYLRQAITTFVAAVCPSTWQHFLLPISLMRWGIIPAARGTNSPWKVFYHGIW